MPSPSAPSARDRFFTLLTAAIDDGSLIKLTLGAHVGADPTLKHLYVRPVQLRAGPHLSFVWRHATRNITKNHLPAAAMEELSRLVGPEFRSAHLFTPAQVAQLEWRPAEVPDATPRLTVTAAPSAPSAPPEKHDRPKQRLVAGDAPWLQALKVTSPSGQPREGMSAKFRQIQKFTELLLHFITDAPLPADRPWQLTDFGSGKGYLTFAASVALGERAQVLGLERRQELVTLCNRVAAEADLARHLSFKAGSIATADFGTPDIVVALHACDTATDDALARAHAARAALILVAPCCQQELRPQLSAPPVLAPALRHGIWQERHAEFATDALRALLLEWAGYRVQVLEFVSTEHTAKNVLIVATRLAEPLTDDERARRAAAIRALASFYGITLHALATHLGFGPLVPAAG